MVTENRDDLRLQVQEAGGPAAQIWPLKTFAYRNPLRGFEDLPFDDAVRQGGHLTGGSGYLSNSEYRAYFRAGRITAASLHAAMERVEPAFESEPVRAGGRSVKASEVLWAHLVEGIEASDLSVLRWTAREEGLSALLESAESAVPDPAPAAPEDAPALPAGRTLSDWLETLAGVPVVGHIDEQMVKWSAAFLDEGLAGWGMPSRSRGFYQAWRELAVADRSLDHLGGASGAEQVRALPDSPEEAISACLDRLGIPDDRRGEYQARMCAQLPGWTGFVRWRSENPTYPGQQEHPVDLVDYLAVRMFYEAAVVEAVARRELGVPGTLRELAARASGSTRANGGARRDQAVSRLFRLAQCLGLRSEELRSLGPAQAGTVLDWLERFPESSHAPVWLEALEDSYRVRLVARLHAHRGRSSAVDGRPSAQLILCIDARSEPFRRHVESQGPYETFGYAGFFGVPISHTAFDNPDRLALCPVLLKPGRAVDEVVRPGEEAPLRRYASGSRWRRLADDLFHDLKKSPLGAFMVVDAAGFLFGVGLAGKTALHAWYGRLAQALRRRFEGPVRTRVSPARSDADTPLPFGFTIAEQAAFVEGGLRMIGLTDAMARLVVVCGHGAESDNNPYAAAYNCGACGGAHGDPNARAFANMANDPAVREAIRGNGLEIPDDTWFLAAKHDTTTDQVSFYDVHDLPPTHAEDLRRLQDDLGEAGALQAAKRLARLPGAPQKAAPGRAVRHALGRSTDWANPRPEWGLSSNAAFLIGRRAVTKGLDLESRVFLHSYDPVADAAGANLEKIMTAPLIVGEWINMEYYFSSVDPWVYGSGSKVLHNVVGGVGVMLGSQGDLQGGLPLQGVNDGETRYHEPMRLLAVIEAPTDRISAIIAKHGVLQQLFHNQWVNLVALEPESGSFHRYNPDATWEPLLPREEDATP